MNKIDIHLFVCTNFRNNNANSCGKLNGRTYFELARKLLKETGLKNARASSSECMGQCAFGPIAVCYPSGKWWHIHDENTVYEMISDITSKNTIE